MPIRADNRGRYPKAWKAIRARILARAENKCEWCGVENRAWGYRDWDGDFHPCDKDAVPRDYGRPYPPRVFQIVLTIAHVHDKSPENCADDNLAALCQKCHLRHDHADHVKSAAETRRRKADEASGQTTLPEVV
jgi:hypothetical protein